MSLEACSKSACRLHGGLRGCRVAAGVPRVEIPDLLSNGGGLDQDRCELLEILQRHFRRDGASPEEALSGIHALVTRAAGSRGRAETVNASYLVTAVEHELADERRRKAGRVRCGSCAHYGPISRRCLRRDAPYAFELVPETDPRRLDPRCEHFFTRRARSTVELEAVPARSEGSAGELIERALSILRPSATFEADVLIAVDLDGLSLRELSRRTGVDRRRLSQLRERAIRQLGAILEDFV